MLVGSTKKCALKASILPYTYRVHKCNLRFLKQEFQLFLGWADRTVYTRKPASDFRLWKNDFPEWLQSHIRNGNAAISNLKLTLAYNTIIRRTWVMAAGSNIAFKIAAKLLHG